MRLTCPNCDAQYEVPDDVIPSDGRDVQCSSCGNTWFQAHADQEGVAPEEPEAAAPEMDWTPDISEDEPLNDVTEAEAVEDARPEDVGPMSMSADAPDEVLAAAVKAAIRRAQPEPEEADDEIEATDTEGGDVVASDAEDLAKEEPEADEEQQFEDDLEAALNEPVEDVEEDVEIEEEDDSVYFEPSDEPEEPLRETEGKRRTIDPTVANILQEEAALEAERRAGETSLESQPDLGLDKTAEKPLDDAAKRAKQARERMARMRGLPADAADKPAEPIPTNSRRDLLPDIEEINSTLRATEDRAPEEQPDGRPTASQRRAGGSRIGFAMAFLLIGLFAYIYNRPDVVSGTVPGSENYVVAYVNFVDNARLGLDAQMTKLMLWLDGFSSEG